MDNSIKISILSLVLSIAIPVGGIVLYFGKLDEKVTHLSSQSEDIEKKIDKVDERTRNNETNTSTIKTDIKYHKESIEKIDKKIDEIYNLMLKENQETKQLMLKALEKK